MDLADDLRTPGGGWVRIEGRLPYALLGYLDEVFPQTWNISHNFFDLLAIKNSGD